MVSVHTLISWMLHCSLTTTKSSPSSYLVVCFARLIIHTTALKKRSLMDTTKIHKHLNCWFKCLPLLSITSNVIWQEVYYSTYIWQMSGLVFNYLSQSLWHSMLASLKYTKQHHSTSHLNYLLVVIQHFKKLFLRERNMLNVMLWSTLQRMLLC